MSGPGAGKYLVNDRYWFALMVPPHLEFTAADILNRSGQATFVPYQTRWRRPNRYVRRKREVIYPLLPRYVLCGFDTEVPPWFSLSRLEVPGEMTRLITSVVGVGGRPTLLRAGAMEALANAFGSGLRAPKSERFMQTHREFGVGDTVTISSGPFAESMVKVEAIKGQVAKVFLPLFGGDVPVEIGLGDLAG